MLMLLSFRMARNFKSDDVCEMFELSDWDNSSGGESIDDVDEDGECLDLLDIEHITHNYATIYIFSTSAVTFSFVFTSSLLLFCPFSFIILTQPTTTVSTPCTYAFQPSFLY